MNKRVFLPAILALAAGCASAAAQAPTPTIDPSSHGNLAAAQGDILQAWQRISEAQRENDDRLGGHAGRAKDFLNQANQELQLAAQQADANGTESSGSAPAAANAAPAVSVPQPPNVSGNWTIYAYNTSQPGSSLKSVQLNQDGNVLSGNFHGPNQHGKLQGWISGNHVEFSTDTREVLTFRGTVAADGSMSGMYGVHGQNAPWKAQRN